MNCRTARKHMVSFLDGELKDATEFGAHINGCAACRDELLAFRQALDETVRHTRAAEPEIRPASDLLMKLHRRIDAAERRATPDWRWRWVLNWVPPQRLTWIGWVTALILLSVQMGRVVRVETIERSSYSDPEFVEIRTELRIGSQIRLPLILNSEIGARVK